MELASVNDERDAVIEGILKRLDRVEKRLRVLERERKPAMENGFLKCNILRYKIL